MRYIQGKKLLPIILLMAVFSSFFIFDLHHFITLESLKNNRIALLNHVNLHPILSVSIFITLYIIVVAASLPIATLFSLTGGFLFGTIFGTITVVISATIGATVIYLAAKSAFRTYCAEKAGNTLKKFENKFQQGAFSYLLFLRLVPIFPFFLINIAAALLNVPLKTYVTSTLIGIIPGAIIYTSLGNGLGVIFEAGQNPDLALIFKPEILFPLLGLAFISLIPAIYKQIRKHHGNS